MCRIFGHFGQAKIGTAEINLVALSQASGGPDSRRIINKGNWSLGCNRLAIQDLNGGEQPYNLAEEIYVAFNGEIYNHVSLRNELSKIGYVFSDNCDGSIIPALYKEYGKDFVSRIEGMFAIAIVDLRVKPALYLFSDQAGMKSLYYWWDKRSKTLYFSSELPSLLCFYAVCPDIRWEAVDEYLSLRAVCGEKTIMKDVKTLPPATLVRTTFEKSPVCSELPDFKDATSDHYTTESEELLLLLKREMSRMLQTDAPVCLVTSGGLDSSLLTVLAQSLKSEPISTFHLCYQGSWPASERHYAREVARSIGAKHYEVELNTADFPVLFEKMIEKIGQPNTAPHNLSTYALFEKIKSTGFKVAITGEGADEYFGGYERFMMAATSKADNWADKYMDLMGPFGHKLLMSLYSYDFCKLLAGRRSAYDRTNSRFRKLKQGDERLQHLLEYDQYERLPYYIHRRVDHLSMAHSVETRMPFCQPKIRALSGRINIKNKYGKEVLYKTASSLLPKSVLERKKQPFTLPIKDMMRKGEAIYEYTNDILHSRTLAERGIFDVKRLEQLIDANLVSPTNAYANALWSIVTLEVWFQKNMDERRQYLRGRKFNL